MNYFTKQGNLNFGKHRGKHHSKVPTQYLNWCCKTIKHFNEYLEAAKHGISLNSDKQQSPMKSACGNGSVANKWFRPPNPKRFQSRAKRIVGATLD